MVNNKNYIPDRGDIVWINLDQTLGHEQKGRRPILVISSKKYNKASGLMLAVPITSKSKNYPFEVKVTKNKVSGVVISDQIKSLDWKARNANFISKIEKRDFEIVQSYCRMLISD